MTCVTYSSDIEEATRQALALAIIEDGMHVGMIVATYAAALRTSWLCARILGRTLTWSRETACIHLGHSALIIVPVESLDRMSDRDYDEIYAIDLEPLQRDIAEKFVYDLWRPRSRR